MKNFTLIMVAICCPVIAFCQDITGLWKGTLYNDSTKQTCEYEIVITKDRGKYTGYSQTSFIENETRYFGIKKLNVRIAKDGKIVMQDAKLVEENYPGQPNKNVIQLNVLDLAGTGDQMNGQFVTNRSKHHQALTGTLSVKRVSSSSKSELVGYLGKSKTDNAIVAVKMEE